ncbi:TPA: hypothetical protein U2M28_001333 [Providencia stuartii]|uniref:hypothetical protein n=1 Tax=Providencia stuartii TaxID=588 RepID=UPI00090B95EC|nr:hypothetical protein [Providencia stuartii]APG52522.1 hypothetical protein BGK56_16860 [Providencia stuartii]AVL41244.1 hypothetical protein CEP70_15255 [Providencia stuartii]MBG5904537.1 hypothetical protein [Providencia stuartii]MBG5912188.1 hypothetical protein [Providencia stuartii]MBG5916130.1 hypothetical protein [Providencia stuartii]
MAKDKKEVKTETQEPTDVIEVDAEKEKTCFVIMPISDHPDYDDGHFKRVYDHIISPACKKAGYKPVIATDSKASNLIMFNILKNIVECDMAICDLSTKNANVFYELGLRQAFNKKTILITDGKEREPFDITGFRYVKYSPSLRIDTVERNVTDIADMLKETELADENDINSITSLLKIHPASIDKSKEIELSNEGTMIIKMLDSVISKLNNESYEVVNSTFSRRGYNNNSKFTLFSILKNKNIDPFSLIYRHKDNEIGKLMAIGKSNLYFSGVKSDYSVDLARELSIPNSEDTQKEIYVLYIHKNNN